MGVELSLVQRAAKAAWEELMRQDPVEGFGYMDIDDNKTVLDGAYDLEAMARVIIDIVKTERDLFAGGGPMDTPSR